MSAAAAALSPTERARILFGEEHGRCCSCCSGYCPLDDSPAAEWVWPLCRLTVDGVSYISDRVIMVREDLLEFTDASVADVTPKSLEWATVPAERPPAAQIDRMPFAVVLDRLDRTSLTLHIHDGDDKASHLYLGEQHVGWTVRARDGWQCDLADLQIIRKVAIAAVITLNQAERAVHALRINAGEAVR